MAKTATKTATKAAAKAATVAAVIVTAIAKAVDGLRDWKEKKAEASAAFDSVAQIIKAEVLKLKYDQKQAQQATFLTLQEAYNFEGNEKELETFRKRYLPEVSKIMRLAFPKTPAAEKQLEVAREHNQDADYHERINENDMLEIARGNKTAKQVIEHKSAKKSAKRGEYTIELFNSNVSAEVSKARKAGLKKAAIEKQIERMLKQWDANQADAEAEETD